MACEIMDTARTKDADLRRALLASSLVQGAECVLQEVGVGNGASRVDVAAIYEDEIVGYEIKSAADTLTRLGSQVEMFSAVFDRMWAVVAPRHLEAVSKIVFPWWGLAVSDGATVEIVRPAEFNHDVDPVSVCRLLWREEMVHLLEAADLARGYRSATATALRDRMADKFALFEIREDVRRCLVERHRGGWLRPAAGGES